MASAYRRSQRNPFSKSLCLLAVPTNWPGKPVGNMSAAIQPTIREKTFNHNSMRYSTINRRENERSLGRKPRGFAEMRLGNCHNCQEATVRFVALVHQHGDIDVGFGAGPSGHGRFEEGWCDHVFTLSEKGLNSLFILARAG